MQGYQYSDLLLAKGDYAAAGRRAKNTIEVAVKKQLLRDIALGSLTLSRAHIGLAIDNVAGGAAARHEHASAAHAEFERAVNGLHAFGEVAFIARGLLGRAVARRSIGDWDGTARDLDEVEETSDVSPLPMRLCLCDMALERARLAFARREAFAPLNGLIGATPPRPQPPNEVERKSLRDEAAMQLAIAANHIETCGYHRRDEELAELQAVLHGECTFASLPPRP